MRLRFALLFVAGCQLVLPIKETDDAGEGSDSSTDADASDASDGGSPDGRVQDNTTVFCGPTLECSTSNPSIGCCLTYSDSGSPPANFIYDCLTKQECAEAGPPFTAQLIQCDEPSDCNAGQVCCWPSTATPRVTYCFPQDAGNCYVELCNPNDAVPCTNHPGYNCAPTRDGWPTSTPSLGYFACRNPSLGP